MIDITKFLPHRYPFLLVDKVCEIDDKKIIAAKNVSYNEGFFQGHFPDNPVFPGVLMVEALAQTACILVLNNIDEDKRNNYNTYLTGVDNAKFKRLVKPGDILTLEVTIEKQIKSIAKFNCVAKVGDELACSVMITAALVEKA